MNPTFVDNGDGTFSQQVLTPFDPVATQAQIDLLNQQRAAAAQLASDEASKPFQSQIDALQALLDASAAQLPQITTLLQKSEQPAQPADPTQIQTS